eukprot:TRINITY_DN3840_c0_g1_i1.p1 TRINITY_DN3840_c0_g1~~TRINITY_DN3840_c0_g1_i1.p1  ORF type:complete len:531 (+),score=159.08 TRINITY_DN3840_c0_g1_i1:206-1798(+)
MSSSQSSSKSMRNGMILFLFSIVFCFSLVESGAVNSIRYSNVGGSGTYPQITRMDPGDFAGGCDTATEKANACVKQDKTVSGPLSPFDDEVTVVFRGPMNIRKIAVYQPSNQDSTRDSTWNQVSSFTANSANPNNLVFMNNMGGGKSGTWSICGGASQSYSSGNFQSTVATANAETFGSYIPAGKEVNIMTSTACSNNAPCSGFSRGTANHGWSKSKMFVFQYDMPTTSDAPAIWVLNAQIVRAAQYGCNCRGMGGNGGCGELDLNEIIPGQDLTHGISEIYSFKGADGTGDNNWFARPTDTNNPVTMIALFDVETDTITVQHVTGYTWPSSHTAAQIDAYSKSTAMNIPFGPANSWTKASSSAKSTTKTSSKDSATAKTSENRDSTKETIVASSTQKEVISLSLKFSSEVNSTVFTKIIADYLNIPPSQVVITSNQKDSIGSYELKFQLMDGNGQLNSTLAEQLKEAIDENPNLLSSKGLPPLIQIEIESSTIRLETTQSPNAIKSSSSNRLKSFIPLMILFALQLVLY